MLDIKKKLQEEIVQLEHELRHELPKEIRRARELGDLSENAEYHAAKQRQSFVQARAAQLHQRMQMMSMIDLSKIPADRSGLGSTVKVMDVELDEEVVYRLVTSEEADVAKGFISTSSPIGRALLNKQVGDEVRITSPGGVRNMEVLHLRTIHEID